MVDQGTGFFATVGQHRTAQGSARRMVRKRHSRSDHRATNANEPPRFGRMDQIEFGDVPSIAKMAALLASMNRDVPMEGKSRSTLMSSLIDEADAKASTALMLHPESSIKREGTPVTGTEVRELVRPTIQAFHTTVFQMTCQTVSSSIPTQTTKRCVRSTETWAQRRSRRLQRPGGCSRRRWVVQNPCATVSPSRLSCSCPVWCCHCWEACSNSRSRRSGSSR